MRIKEEFVKTELGDSAILVPVGAADDEFHGVIRLNETAAFLVDQLRQNVTEEDLVLALLNEYDVERSVAEKNIRAVLDSLRKVKALEE